MFSVEDVPGRCAERTVYVYLQDYTSSQCIIMSIECDPHVKGIYGHSSLTEGQEELQ